TTQLVELEVDATDAESEQAFTVSIANADLPLGAISAPGVYGVQAELSLEAPVVVSESTQGSTTGEATDTPEVATSLTSTTTVVWRGQSFGQRLPVTLVVPIVLPEGVRSMPTRADLSDAAPRLDE